MEPLIITMLEDIYGHTLQLYKVDDDTGATYYNLAADFIDVADFGGGCYWCATFTTIAAALKGINKIIKQLERDNGAFNTNFLIKNFGKGTC